MNVASTFSIASYIYPRAEAEVVFKISKEISAPIQISEVLDYVDQVTVGMEIFDYRYGQAQIYSNDAIADNAGAAAFAFGNWVPATHDVFENVEIKLTCDSQTLESAPLSAIRGNPWEAVVQLSALASSQGLTLKKDWIIFSGSATKGVLLTPGKLFAVEASGIGVVEVKTE
jgi:2-oxopent-4-enoate/cis-2-oxohex-4-enoate hydratase